MKRLLELLSFSLLVLILVSSFSKPGKAGNGHSGSISPEIVDDTTGLIRLLEIDTFNLSILPPSSGVQFYKDKILFLSRSKNEMKMTPKQISFGAVELYSADVKDSVTGKHIIFFPSSSFSYPCEAITFSHDYNTFYFTMIPKKAKKEKIYSGKLALNAQNQPVLVTDFIPLEFCSDNSTYSHPALSPDDDIMIFASDRAGSIGGMDLYVTKKAGLMWSDPVNLGNIINTPGNEFFPFLDSKKNLYFSSDRLPGFGGYDIFTCRFNGGGWDKPMNLSDRINSDKDDIAFTISRTDGRTAFFTRRQKAGNAEMQLFRIKLKKETTESNQLNISYIFNGTPVSKPNVAIAALSETTKPVKAVSVKSQTRKQTVTESVKPEQKKQSVAKPVGPKPEPPKPTQAGQKDVVLYKVQILPDRGQIKTKKMDIGGTSYKIEEYLYLGAIRYTIGEFSSLVQATSLQKICRQAGYGQSFVVAFKNQTRSLDKNLFK